MTAAAVDANPAGGAATADVLIGFTASTLFIAALLALGLGHRSGRVLVLARAGRALERASGIPGWAALPGLVALGAFLIAGVGFVWDVALHVAQGRDSGPFGTPAHYLMLAGIFGFVGGGWLAVCLPPESDRRPSWVRIRNGWHAPTAGLAMLATAAFSFAGFPLDDMWHKAFGQDVTLWGPTHLMMISGGLFHFFALVLLFREARRAGRARGLAPHPWLWWFLAGTACTVALTGLTLAYQQEFAYGIPQFRLLFQPALIAFSAGAVLVAARLGLGRGGALSTAISTCAVLGALTLLVGPLFGSLTHHFPLYLAEAALVELVALSSRRLRGYRLAVAAGVAIGTLGVLAEWGWSHVWMPLPWPAHILPEAMLRAVPLAVAGGVIGAFAGRSRRDWLAPSRRDWLAPSRRDWLAPAGALAVAVVSLASLLPTGAPALRAQITTTPAGPGAVDARVRLTPASAADDADWFTATAWQGGAQRVVVAALERVGSGEFRTREPLPVGGSWKSMLRLHRGSVMETAPLSLPRDSAIPAPAIAIAPRIVRTFRADRKLMQRERRKDVPGWLFSAASAAVAVLTLAMLLLLGWVLVRESATGLDSRHGEDREDRGRVARGTARRALPDPA